MTALPARLLLAILLAFGSEIILWPHVPARGPLDWLAGAVGYLTLGAILPDLMRRYHVRDAIGLLAVAGLAGLILGVLLHPQSALAEMPLTLVSRVLGAQTAVALAMLALWLALLRSRLPLWLWAAAAFTGMVWGLFGRWFPSTLDAMSRETPFGLFLIAGVLALATIALVWRAVAHQTNLHSDHLLLSRRAWALAVAALAALIILRAGQQWLDLFALAVALLLAAFLWLILRLYWRKREPGLLASALPPQKPNPRFLALALVFLIAGVAGYSLPRLEGDADPLRLLGALQVAFGAVWLPSLSLVVGGQMLIREIRAQQL